MCVVSSVPYHLRASRDVEPWGAGQAHGLAQQVQEGKDTVEKQQPLTLQETRVLGRQAPSLLLVAVYQDEHLPRHGVMRNPDCSQAEKWGTDLGPLRVCNPRRVWQGGHSYT